MIVVWFQRRDPSLIRFESDDHHVAHQSHLLCDVLRYPVSWALNVWLIKARTSPLSFTGVIRVLKSRFHLPRYMQVLIEHTLV